MATGQPAAIAMLLSVYSFMHVKITILQVSNIHRICSFRIESTEIWYNLGICGQTILDIGTYIHMSTTLIIVSVSIIPQISPHFSFS